MPLRLAAATQVEMNSYFKENAYFKKKQEQHEGSIRKRLQKEESKQKQAKQMKRSTVCDSDSSSSDDSFDAPLLPFNKEMRTINMLFVRAKP